MSVRGLVCRRTAGGSNTGTMTSTSPMGLPSTGVESLYRNRAEEVAQLLASRHGQHVMVYNLSGRSYDYSLFSHQVLEFPFPDHHNPPLHLVLKAVHSISGWLSADQNHVAAVHCLAGKGRTGTVIACYLMFAGMYHDPETALAHFAHARSHDGTGFTSSTLATRCARMHWYQARAASLGAVSRVGCCTPVSPKLLSRYLPNCSPDSCSSESLLPMPTVAACDGVRGFMSSTLATFPLSALPCFFPRRFPLFQAPSFVDQCLHSLACLP
eukprot:TRINITY_DN68_c0_g1_i2.p1 TRINITY_DN68_c0_g1~~TRINITY_DN68_c0_g1_i2.p1  ORF type:complete len:269 (+),score=23.18 TRINITY_DN68_c0_g1_i2:176-982(+)